MVTRLYYTKCVRRASTLGPLIDKRPRGRVSGRKYHISTRPSKRRCVPGALNGCAEARRGQPMPIVSPACLQVPRYPQELASHPSSRQASEQRTTSRARVLDSEQGDLFWFLAGFIGLITTLEWYPPYGGLGSCLMGLGLQLVETNQKLYLDSDLVNNV